MRAHAAMVIAVAVLLSASCGSDAPSTSPTPPASPSAAAVTIVFQGATSRRTDLPVFAQACVDGVGATHIHPSWRNFAGIPLTAVPPSRYELSFADVPVNTRVTFRVNDQNFCDENNRRRYAQRVGEQHHADSEHHHTGKRRRAWLRVLSDSVRHGDAVGTNCVTRRYLSSALPVCGL